MNRSDMPEVCERRDEIVGTILTTITADRIFDMFMVYRKSGREICKNLRVQRHLVEGALRWKVNQICQSGRVR
jgi:hypothetical protein